MSVQRADVEAVASLARLRLEEGDLEQLTRDLNAILEHVVVLQGLEGAAEGEDGAGTSGGVGDAAAGEAGNAAAGAAAGEADSAGGAGRAAAGEAGSAGGADGAAAGGWRASSGGAGVSEDAAGASDALAGASHAQLASTRDPEAEEPDALRGGPGAAAPDWRDGFFVVPAPPGVQHGGGE